MRESPTLRLENSILIAWQSDCYRASATARTFEADLLLLPCIANNLICKPLSYIKCMIITLVHLVKRHPDYILCVNLPVFLPLACHVYVIISGSKVIMDFHSGALTKRIWRLFLPYYKYLARHSPFTICHNRSDNLIIQSWGGRTVLLMALPKKEFPGVIYKPTQARPLFLFVCSFAPDEPVEMVIRAMKACPEFDFIISGNFKKRNINPDSLPSNITLPGYMNYEDYIGVMAKATAVITLSTRKHIMQMAIHEALTLGVPVITNESPTLREVLGDGGIFINLDCASLHEAINKAVLYHSDLMSAIRIAKIRAWDLADTELKNIAKTIFPKE